MGRLERVGWGIVAVVLVVLGIPWFLWGSDAIVFGLPIWLWWHVGWMLVAALTFWLFANRAWGTGIEPRGEVDAPVRDGTDGTGDRP